MITKLEIKYWSEETRLKNTKRRFNVHIKSFKCSQMEPLL